MTTAHSPRRVLKAQAKKIAGLLKKAERGEKIDVAFGNKIAAARSRESVTFAVAMDDKILKIKMAWATIRDTSEAGITEFILNQMREAHNAVN